MDSYEGIDLPRRDSELDKPHDESDVQLERYDAITDEGPDPLAGDGDYDDDSLAGAEALEDADSEPVLDTSAAAGGVAMDETVEIAQPSFPHSGVRRTLHGVVQDLHARGVDVRGLLGEGDQRLFDALLDPSRSTPQVRDDLGLSATRLYKDSRDLVRSILDTTSESLGTDAPERTMLGGLRDGLAGMGVNLAEVLPDRTLQRVVELLRDETVSYADVADQLGVDVNTVRGMVTSVVGLVSEKAPGLVDRILGADASAVSQTVGRPGAVAAEREVRGPRPAISDETHVGGKVDAMIREAGLTPTQIARELGIVQSRMSRFLSGQTEPLAEEVLLPILRRLNIPQDVIDELLDEYGPGRARGPGASGGQTKPQS